MSTARIGWWLTLALAAGLPLSAQATYQLTAKAHAHAVASYPAPGASDSDPKDLNLLNKPGAAQLQQLDSFASTADGSATALFLGRIGLLKAYAASDYARCCVNGATLLYGNADATVETRFYDEVLVQGAGLADGTPVRYRLDLRLSGTVSSPSHDDSGYFNADAQAEAGLRDTHSGAAASFRWDARNQATGVFSLTVDTAVGHTLAVSGRLYAGTYVSAGALIARSAEVDFYHSAGYYLAPSVAGLNTVGASGTDFTAAAVPEPATWALWGAALGLAGGVNRVRRLRRSGRPAG